VPVCPGRAADLTAETFAQAWISRQHFRDDCDGSALPWLLGIGRNVLRESVRRDRIETRARERLGLPLDLASDDGYEAARVGGPCAQRSAGQPRSSCTKLPSIFATAFINLYTADIEAGIRFYRDLLGFKETFRTPTEGIPEHVELTLNGFALGLGTVQAAKRVHGVDASPGSPAMVLVVWTDDVDAAFEQLKSAGVPVVQPPHDTGNNNRNALLRDPDGNLVEIAAKVA
jgi:lactoylglutathione lyase